MKNVIESIQEDQKHNNKRKMYQTVNQFEKGYQPKYSIIRVKKGELAMNTKEKAEIRKEYFDKLLNTEELRELIKKGNRFPMVSLQFLNDIILTMALGLTQPLREMSTRNISWGVKAASAYGS